MAAMAERVRSIESLELELQQWRERERAWRRREQELRDFLDNAAVGLHMVGRDGTIIWANRADHEMLGYSAEEYVGRNIAEFHADHGSLASVMERLQTGETIREQPAVLKCKDGSVRHVLVSSNAHFEDGKFVHTRCFTVDVTAQRLAEAALLEARRHLGAIVESSEDAIIAIDLSGRINSWNLGAERLYCHAREEIIGKPISTIIPPNLHIEEQQIIERVGRGERIEHYETVRLRKDGSRVEVSLTVSPVRDAEGRLVGISKVARDITDRKKAQRELAQEARRKDEFLAILAHELRNPLAPIRYALSIAKQGAVSTAQARRAGEVIERQVEHMARLLDDLLDVSRIARGRVELRRKRVDLTSVIGAAIDAARPLIDSREHQLSLDLPREPLRIEADPVRITQVLSNLLNNAAKYTDPGGRIELRAWREGDEIVFVVRDNGIGIAPEMRERLFNLFSQALPAIERSEGGLGIGLALVKGFVELHGGTIEARSAGPGKGSEFVVRIPVGETGAAEVVAEKPVAADPRQRLRILVADDNADAAETCAMLLELWGHEVEVVHGGQAAVVAAEQFRPHVALLDIGMPQLNGYQVAELMRAAPWGRHATLVAVTGWGQEEDRQHALSAGFDHHLTKPVDPKQLQPLLESLR